MEIAALTPITTDRLEQALVEGEASIARIRAGQIRLLSEIDARQVPLGDGCRNLSEWVAARLDLAPETARRLTQTAGRLVDQPDLAVQLEDGAVSFDRATEEARLIETGANPELVERSRGWDIAGVRRMVARHQRMCHQDEHQIFDGLFLSMQPSLDQSSYRMWGLFAGTDGRIVEQALLERADGFPTPPNGRQASRSQRNADALVSIAQDSLEGSPDQGRSAVPLVSIFLDAELAAATDGEAGGEVALGPRIGPLTLEQILCDGSVEILKTSPSGQPLSVGPTARTIPPKLRRSIIHRDGGACTVDGCRSRYRLQPHHIKPRSQGGSHDPSNLTTLCWFHHHVVVHRNGYRIDPDSPPHRRRFLQPNHRGPP